MSVRRSPGQGTIVYDAGNVKGASIGEMDVREAIVLGQAVVHPDGTYTQTRKVENDSNLLAQYTMSPNGVRLWKRIISCSASGRPEEVMIYDHHDELRFRGVLSYDRLGRFREEVIFDTHGNVLRQRIQEYGPAGPKLKVIDDLAKVPADMRLVITREDGAVNQEVARRNYQEFLEQAEERPAQTAASGAEPEKPKRGLFKLFGGGKNKEKN